MEDPKKMTWTHTMRHPEVCPDGMRVRVGGDGFVYLHSAEDRYGNSSNWAMDGRHLNGWTFGERKISGYERAMALPVGTMFVRYHLDFLPAVVWRTEHGISNSPIGPALNAASGDRWTGIRVIPEGPPESGSDDQTHP
jgi:hypothetical protein